MAKARMSARAVVRFSILSGVGISIRGLRMLCIKNDRAGLVPEARGTLFRCRG